MASNLGKRYWDLMERCEQRRGLETWLLTPFDICADVRLETRSESSGIPLIFRV